MHEPGTPQPPAPEPSYPGRLRHDVPAWVPAGASFHIRLRLDGSPQAPLTHPERAPRILDGFRNYHATARWWCRLVVLMPDHLHAILSFPPTARMAVTVGAWKRGATRFHGVRWQDNFFDHRLRHEAEADECWHYLMRNPVAKGLVATPEAWPWRWSP